MQLKSVIYISVATQLEKFRSINPKLPNVGTKIYGQTTSPITSMHTACLRCEYLPSPPHPVNYSCSCKSSSFKVSGIYAANFQYLFHPVDNVYKLLGETSCKIAKLLMT